MKVLDRYLLRSALPALGVSLVVLAFVLVMHRMFLLSDLVVARGVPLSTVGRLMALALPALLPILLPVSLLVAVLLTTGRLSLDHEAVAMRASGVSLAQNLRPLIWLSAAVTAVAAAVSLWGQPAAARAFRQELYDAVKNRVGLTAEAGTFTEVAPGITLFAGDTRDGGRELADLFLVVDRGGKGPLWVTAQRGRLWTEGRRLFLDLERGEVHEYEGPGTPYRRIGFRRYRVALPIPGVSPDLDVEELPTARLWAAAANGDPAARLEMHRRLALPAGCLVLGVLGACLGFHHSRFGQGRGYVLGLGVLLLYYALLTVSRALGKASSVPPEAAVWAPQVLLWGLAAFAFARKNQERPLPLEEGLGAAWDGVVRRLRAREERP